MRALRTKSTIAMQEKSAVTLRRKAQADSRKLKSSSPDRRGTSTGVNELLRIASATCGTAMPAKSASVGAPTPSRVITNH